MGPEAYFWDPLEEKEYQITNTKLGMKVNVYLERKKTSQQITKLKMLTNTTNITRSRKVTIFLLINCLTFLHNTFLPTFIGCILFLSPFHMTKIL